MPPKRNKGLGIYLAVLLALMLFAMTMFNFDTHAPSISYTEIVSYFQQHRVREFTLDMGTGDLEITKLEGENPANLPILYKVPSVTMFWNDTRAYIEEYNLEHPDDIIQGTYKPAQEMPWWVSLLPTLLLIGLMVVFWVLMMRQSRGGGNVAGFGKAKARSAQDGRRVTFADVAGADEEKEELIEIVEFLKNPGKFNALGARIPKGVILMGPPGTGKTLLARAVAGEAQVQFFSISGSDFVEMFVGVGASRVRDLFEQAKKNAPSVIFIDEIDAVGRQRGAGLGGGHDEREQTLNQLLVEMDGFSTNSGVIVLAATNRRDILDPALMRPGRFDRQITVGYPDIKGREEILRVHSKNKPLAPDVDLKTIAGTTPGWTGADLENLMNEAALLAARKGLKAITMKEIEEANIKVAMGPEKRSKVLTAEDRKLTAYHEAGHALCFYFCPTQDPVHQVTIVPRGPAGGFTMPQPTKDHMYVTKTRMFEDIVVSLGGRVAEQLVLDDISTGASNDLQQATKIARSMITRYGFSEKLGPVVYSQDPDQVFLGRDYVSGSHVSDAIQAEIDAEIRRVIDEAYQRCTEILTEHMDKLHLVAQKLLEKEKLNSAEFKALMESDEKPKPLSEVVIPELKIPGYTKEKSSQEEQTSEEAPTSKEEQPREEQTSREQTASNREPAQFDDGKKDGIDNKTNQNSQPQN